MEGKRDDSLEGVYATDLIPKYQDTCDRSLSPSVERGLDLPVPGESLSKTLSKMGPGLMKLAKEMAEENRRNGKRSKGICPNVLGEFREK